MTTFERISESPARLGECPVWSPDENVLYWIDIDGRKIHRYDPSTGSQQVREMPARPGSLALSSDPNRLLLAMEHELVWVDWDSGATSGFLTLEPPATGNRLNDGRCDPAGRFVVGSMFADTRAARMTGLLHRVDASGVAETLGRGIGVANGLAFDPTLGRMYFADTFTDRVVVWDYDEASGRRGNERTFLDYSELPGKPDGACVDVDGCYWSASVFGSAVIRVTPAGKIDRRVELPVLMPTMPAFGGSDLKTLYITSIGTRQAGTGQTANGGFVGGETLAVDVGVQGIQEPLFGLGVR